MKKHPTEKDHTLCRLVREARPIWKWLLLGCLISIVMIACSAAAPKLLGGLMKACEKRPVSLMQLEQIVDNVEQRVFGSLESEVSSKVIGELVMEQLRKVDEVAYVRFASVYRQFKDINTFMEELNTLLKEK